MHGLRTGAGFALTELIAILIVLVLLAVLLLTAGAESRRLARLGDDIAKLRDIGAATTSYAADNQDLIWSFSWQGGVTYNTPYTDLNFANDDLQAQANQAIYILRTHGGVPEAPKITGWIANISYSHFVLAQHQNRRLPDFGLISSADKLRLQWAQNPAGTGNGPYGPYACTANPIHCKTLPRSASFRLVAAAYDGSPAGSRISQAALFNQFNVPPSAELGGRPLTEVAFPSQKVLAGDMFARHFGPASFCTEDRSRLPLLFADGGVHVRAAADSNPGWQPNNPASPQPTTFGCQPSTWEPCTAPGPILGRFLWTRGTTTQNGLAGRDFGGPETCSGQPGCP